VAYAVSAFLAIQAADVLVPAFGLPDWVVRLVAALSVVGFPVAVGLAWAFDRTAEGIVRTPPGPAPDARAPAGGQAKERLDPHAIAVLPFLNMSDHRENEFFSDGVTEDILTNLSKTGRFRVISRTSMMTYKGTAKSLREIALELNVGSVVEGSVRRAGDRVRVVAQLIDANTDEHLWAETYDRDLHDIFAVQSDVALSIARALEIGLAPETVRRIQATPTRNMEAYDLYLRGRGFPDPVGSWRQDLERAVELDPDFAAAHALLAMNLMYGVYYAQLEPAKIFGRARKAVERALALDPLSAEAHAARGSLAFHYAWDWPRAEEATGRALELDPNQTDAMFTKAAVRITHERYDEGLDLMYRILSVDPHQAFARSHLTLYMTYAGRVDEAERLARDAVRRHPGFFHAYFALGYALQEQGRYEEAIPVWGRLRELAPGVPLFEARRASSLMRVGRGEEAVSVFQEIERRAATEYVDPLTLAVYPLLVGDVERALDHLEAGLRQRAFLMLWMRATPRYRPLRGHPRFQAILRAMWPDDEMEGVPPRA